MHFERPRPAVELSLVFPVRSAVFPRLLRTIVLFMQPPPSCGNLGAAASRFGWLRRDGRRALQHPASAEILINVWPMHAFAISDNLKMAAFGRSSAGQTPRPRERNAHRSSVGQLRDNGIFRNFERYDPRFAIRRNVHPMPPEGVPDCRE